MAMYRLLTRQEFANAVRVSLATADRLIAAGTVRSVRIGRLRRIPEESLRELLQPARPNHEEDDESDDC